MDFFTVPTLTFGVLHCFFVIAHERRRVLHFNVTRHPSSAWISQQLRETFPYDEVPTFASACRAPPQGPIHPPLLPAQQPQGRTPLRALRLTGPVPLAYAGC
jgi:hypothetical protein